MTSEALRIPVRDASVEWVGALLDLPQQDRGGNAILLAHGAGAGMESEFLAALAAGLAARGLPVMRFNYAYAERASREGRRFPPERQPRLLAVQRSALAALRERFPERRVVLAGKSMGGRMASYMAAEGDDCAGLAFLGYPLHPPGKPDRMRSEHFPAIAQPALFVQGTRDALCRLELLEPALATFGGAVTLRRVEEADHDFRLPRSAGRERAELLEELAEAVASWESSTFPL